MQQGNYLNSWELHQFKANEDFTRTACTAFNPQVKICHSFKAKGRKKLLKIQISSLMKELG